jgi:hypothetical protein
LPPSSPQKSERRDKPRNETFTGIGVREPLDLTARRWRIKDPGNEACGLDSLNRSEALELLPRITRCKNVIDHSYLQEIGAK